MANDHSTDELLSFLQHASERGLMPAATAQALAVASRNVFAVLNGAEGSDVRTLNLDDAIKRFTNKRAKDFNPASLTEYARRVRKAVELFLAWRNDPASMSVKTRNTRSSRAVQPKFVNDGPATDTTHVTSIRTLGHRTPLPQMAIRPAFRSEPDI